MPETIFQMRISDDLREKLNAMASDTERDASKFVRWLILREWERQHPAPEKEQEAANVHA